MKKLFLYAILAAAFTSAAVSCDKAKKDNDTNASANQKAQAFSLEFNITQGVITANGVITEPKVILKVTSTDEYESYKVKYSVDGVNQSEISGLWHNRTRDISDNIPLAYGEHIIEGYICPVSDESNSKGFKESVWVIYQPITVEEISFTRGSKSFVVENGSVLLPVDLNGKLNLSFSPAASRAEISVSSSNTDVLAFDEESIEDGRYSIEYYTGDEIGASSEIVIFIKNGESVKEHRFTVILTKPLEIVEISVTGPEEITQLVVRKKGYPVVINLVEGAVKSYAVSYYFDETALEEESETVLFDETRTHQKLLAVPAALAHVSTHTIKVVVTDLDNPSLTGEDTIEFKITGRK